MVLCYLCGGPSGLDIRRRRWNVGIKESNLMQLSLLCIVDGIIFYIVETSAVVYVTPCASYHLVHVSLNIALCVLDHEDLKFET